MKERKKGRSKRTGKLGILFLHHSRNGITLNNLHSIQRHNPKAIIATMSPDEIFPGGYSLNQTPKLKGLHARRPKGHGDLLVCSWFLQRKEKCDKWWIVEWDTFCEISVAQYYRSVWHYPFITAKVCLRHREPDWEWFRAGCVTQEYGSFVMGAVPFLYLLSEQALEGTCRMLIDHPLDFGNSELRFATAANRAGYAPCGFSPPNDRITWITWNRITGPRTIFHPVKHYVDYR